MKTNKDKLNDAVGMLDEETVQGAMSHATNMRALQISRRVTLRRRAMVLLAACLSLTLMLGALLAIPLMTADDPAISETTPPVGETSAPPITGETPTLSYTEAPMVKLSMLTTRSDATVSDTPVLTRGSLPQMDTVNGFFRTFLVLSFDCEAGETVTVDAETACLFPVDLPFNEDTDLGLTGEFMDRLMDIYDARDPGNTTLTMDPATSCILVMMPKTQTALDEDTLTFTVQSEADVTVGAGSVYVGTRYLLDAEAHRLWYESSALTRSAVLGSVRLDAPEDVTAEQISDLLNSFTAETEAAKAELDYTPATVDERYIAARAEIALTVFADEQITGSSTHAGSFLYYQTIQVHDTDKSEKDRGFILFADGTWGEYEIHDNCLAGCHGDGCPAGSEDNYPHALTKGCRITLTDGRIFELVEQEIDGIMMHVPVLISEISA